MSDQYTGNLASTQQKPGSMHSVTLAQVFHKPELFPTPTTQDSSGQCRNHGGDLLHELICGCPRAERREPLLRSPTASQGQGGALGEAEARKRGNTVGIRNQAMDLARLQGHKVSREIANLPTPTTRDYKDGSANHERDGKIQTDTIARAIFSSGEVLLGTPRANAAESSAKQVELNAPKSRIEDQVLTTNWGKFEPAIKRWEAILGREAPEPTKPDGRDGNHRLSSKFTEWMMGLPEGWVTSIGLTRNEELKLCGNGVVPQQAELALRLLLEERQDVLQ